MKVKITKIMTDYGHEDNNDDNDDNSLAVKIIEYVTTTKQKQQR